MGKTIAFPLQSPHRKSVDKLHVPKIPWGAEGAYGYGYMWYPGKHLGPGFVRAVGKLRLLIHDIRCTECGHKAAGKTLVFSTTGRTPISGFSRAKLRLDVATQKVMDITALEADREAEPVPDWRLHDFRRTMVTTMADMGVDPTVADRCLNHKAAATMSTVQRVYQQSDLFEQRKHATNAWTTKVMEWAGVDAASNSSDVIALHKDTAS